MTEGNAQVMSRRYIVANAKNVVAERASGFVPKSKFGDFAVYEDGTIETATIPRLYGQSLTDRCMPQTIARLIDAWLHTGVIMSAQAAFERAEERV